jgi:hypothetical protein
MITRPNALILDAAGGESHAHQSEAALMALENRLIMALARSCCRDGRVNRSSLHPNITTRHPREASCRAGGSRHRHPPPWQPVGGATRERRSPARSKRPTGIDRLASATP